MYKINVSGFLAITILFFLNSCIGEDVINDRVDPVVRILNPIESLSVSKTHQYNASFFNNVGQQENTNISWSSSNELVASISSNGLVTALSEGETNIKAIVTLNNNVLIEDQSALKVISDNQTVTTNKKSGNIATTSSYKLTGSFTLTETGSNPSKLLLSISSTYEASTSLPGLYLYLTNNPNSIANAYSLGPVSVFSGAHSYTIENVGINDYSYLLYWCKPFSVKVGGGQIN